MATWHGSGVDLGIIEALFLHVAAATKSMTRPSDLFGRTIREHNLITDALSAENGAVRVPAGAPESARSSGSMTPVGDIKTPRSTACASSRMFPGHAWLPSLASAASEKERSFRL